MRTMLIGWDRDGRVVRTTSEVVALDEHGEAAGFVDFEAHELAGGSLTDIIVYGAVAVDELPVLPHPRFPPMSDDPDAPPSRRVYLMPERQGYVNRGGAWVVDDDPPVVGAGTWPEFLGPAAHDFRVDVRPGAKGGTHKVRGLIHATSGHRRDRAALVAEVERRVRVATEAREARRAARRATAGGAPPTDAIDGVEVDVGDLFGGPDRPLRLDAEGRTVSEDRPVRGPRRPLPVAAEGAAPPARRDGASGTAPSRDPDARAVLAAMEARRLEAIAERVPGSGAADAPTPAADRPRPKAPPARRT